MTFATVVPTGPSSYYLETDNGTTYVPIAGPSMYKDFDPNKRQWAQTFFTILSDSINGYSHGVKMIDVYNILTKPIAENKGEEENDKFYGNDPVKIEKPDRDLGYGGGYLNIIFKTYYGGGKKHFINLIATEDPYTFEFRHHAYGDAQSYVARGIVGFDLTSFPDTAGETVELTLIFNTFQGIEEIKIPYNSDIEKLKDLQIAPDQKFHEATEIS